MSRHACFIPRLVLLASALVASAAGSVAQEAAPRPAKPAHDKYGSPLDTMMNTHLWTNVPPARDFVTETRPDAKALDYTPLTGSDPERPKPRDTANIAALQAELESDKAKNAAKGHVLKPAPKRKSAPTSAARP